MRSRPRIWVEHGRVDLLGLADEAQIDDGLDLGIGVDQAAGGLARDHHVAVLAAEPDRLAAGPVDETDDLLVDRAREHHLDDFDRRRVGDAQAAGEFRLDAEPLEHLADLRPAAVHDHRVDGGLLHQHDVAGEALGHILLAHGMAAVFHDDDFLVVTLHMGERFRQNVGDVVGRNGHRGIFPNNPAECRNVNVAAPFSEPSARAKEGWPAVCSGALPATLSPATQPNLPRAP